MVEVIESKQQLGELGRNARELAETRADWKQNFPKLLRAYEMAVAVAA